MLKKEELVRAGVIQDTGLHVVGSGGEVRWTVGCCVEERKGMPESSLNFLDIMSSWQRKRTLGGNAVMPKI